MTGAKGARRSDRRNWRLQRAWLPVCALLLVLAVASAWAQVQRPAVTVVPTAPVAGTRVPFIVRIRPSHAVPRGSFVRVRGLPAMAAPSAGHSIGPGSWAIPIKALTDLEITLPTTAAGRSEVTITLVAADGTTLAETRYVLVVSAAPPANAATTSNAVPPAPGVVRAVPLEILRQPPAAPAMAAEARERALRLVRKGDEQLAEGGIAQARLLYERAAEAGLARGAMALAATYDPAEFDRLGARGMKPDLQAARKWYERAWQLGAREAGQRLQRLRN